jgi:hypothetical protein
MMSFLTFAALFAGRRMRVNGIHGSISGRLVRGTRLSREVKNLGDLKAVYTPGAFQVTFVGQPTSDTWTARTYPHSSSLGGNSDASTQE